ncbi:hypothetical protein WMF38_14700 [Sorangium sp. So ce118]
MSQADAFVFFGATGDLAYKMIFPALAALVRRRRLGVPIIGVAKAGWDLERLRARARESLERAHAFDRAVYEDLCARLSYIDGDYGEEATFAALAARLGAAERPLHYLAVPPSLFGQVVESLAGAGCLRSIVPLEPGHVVRGQFKGYRSEPGVAGDSQVETYCAARLHVDNRRWAGVPFCIRSGKRLSTTATEVFVNLRRPPRAVFGDARGGPANYVRIRIDPAPALAVGIQVKRAGEGMEGEPTELVVTRAFSDAMLPYERLLGEALDGDPTLFASQEGVEAEWRVVAPVLDAATPLHAYDPGTWGPAEADRLVADLGGWRNPMPPREAPARAA